MGRDGETEAKDGQRKTATARYILDDIKNRDENIMGFSVYQNTAICRKGQGNCQMNVGCGLKGSKEVL